MNFKQRLSTKKATKLLSDDIKDYLLSLDEGKANCLLDYAYSIAKQQKSIILTDLVDLQTTTDAIYHPEYDIQTGHLKYSLYQRIMWLIIEKKSSNIVEYYANLTFDINCSFAYYIRINVIYLLLRYDTPISFIEQILQYNQAIWDNYSALMNIIHHVLEESKFSDNQKQKLMKEIIKNPIFIDLLVQNIQLDHPEESLVPYLKYHKDIKDCKIENNVLIMRNNPYYSVLKNCKSNLIYLTKAKQFDFSNLNPTETHQLTLTLHHIPCIQYYSSCDKEKFSIHIDYSESTSVIINQFHNNINYRLSGNQTHIVIYNYDNLLYINKNKKNRPLTLKDMVQIASYDTKFEELMDFLLDAQKSTYPFVKDYQNLFHSIMKADETIRSQITIPFIYNDVFSYHNWQEYFDSKYKIAKTFSINYNRLQPTISYCFLKTVSYIRQNDIYLYLEYLKSSNIILIPNSSKKNTNVFKRKFALQMIKNFYLQTLNLVDADDVILVEDWLNLCCKFSIPFSLRKKSLKKIIESHNKLSIIGWEQEHKNDTDYNLIPKNSQFYPLRKILPVDYEWITTHKRLQLESKIMHHCVWSYEDRIKNDTCAIYSYQDPVTLHQHTIEFQKINDHFYINQIQKRYDRGFDKNVLKQLKTYNISFL